MRLEFSLEMMGERVRPGKGGPGVADAPPQKATNRMTPVLLGPWGKEGLCLSGR